MAATSTLSATVNALPIELADLANYFRLLLSEFSENNQLQQYECPSTLSKEQRAVAHQIAEEFELKTETRGNWRKIVYLSLKTN